MIVCRVLPTASSHATMGAPSALSAIAGFMDAEVGELLGLWTPRSCQPVCAAAPAEPAAATIIHAATFFMPGPPSCYAFPAGTSFSARARSRLRKCRRTTRDWGRRAGLPAHDLGHGLAPRPRGGGPPGRHGDALRALLEAGLPLHPRGLV